MRSIIINIFNWLVFLSTTWLITYLGYTYGNTQDGSPKTAEFINLFLLYPFALVGFYFGSGKKKTKMATFFWKILVVGFQAVAAIVYLIFLFMLYCKGGCL